MILKFKETPEKFEDMIRPLMQMVNYLSSKRICSKFIWLDVKDHGLEGEAKWSSDNVVIALDVRTKKEITLPEEFKDIFIFN